jgi:glyceraldehyde-3-phosphate dehydrogenase/erythrose-4-phosphate dehydrogenase
LLPLTHLGSLENLAYLLKHDTVYGKAPFSVDIQNGALMIDWQGGEVLSEKIPPSCRGASSGSTW